MSLHRAGVMTHRVRGACRQTLLLAAACALSVVAQEQADFAILRSVSSLKVLNRYEQPLDDQGRSRFLPNTPVRVVDPEYTMGDQLTTGIALEAFGESFYIPLKEGSSVRTVLGTIYRDCEWLGDTVVVTRSGQVSFSAHPRTSGGAALSKGTRLARVFRRGGRCYALRLDNQPSYGWCPGRGAYELVQEQTTDDSPDVLTDLQRRVAERFEKANRTYRQFFEYFNVRTRTDRMVPRWKQAGTEPLRFELNAPYDRTDELTASTAALVADLEGILLGMAYGVRYADGAITISRRTAED